MAIFKIYYDYVAILQVMDNIKTDLVDVPKVVGRDSGLTKLYKDR
jgi:hypothetical protein